MSCLLYSCYETSLYVCCDPAIFAQVTGFRKLAMRPMSETAFFSNEVDAEVRFSKDADGKMQQLVLRQEGQDMPAKRVN